MENNLAFPQKSETEVPRDTALPVLGVQLRELKTCPPRDLSTDVHSSIVHNRNWKQPEWPSTEGWTKCGVPTQWHVIQSSKGRSTDTRCDADKRWKHDAEWHRPEDRVLYESIYTKYPEEARDRERFMVIGGRGKEDWEVTAHEDGVSFWTNKNVLELYTSDGCAT